ncbi:hypothetical protein LTR42_007714 [Elasticomyces elasticus]|nr:hypothetical protein LTR42_007714 [Elasticomyces elasticus]
MPPLPKTSVADSDEDDDEIIEPEVPQPSQQGGASMTQQSTGSTERMANEIRNAERDLLAPSADQAGSMSRSSGQKRRSTAAVGDTPERAAKRSKTQVQGYGKRSSTTKAAHEQSVFDKFKDDDDAPATSHSARYSEHSGAVHSSAGLPDGTVRADFAAHEPNVMFGNTGSTAVDASSEQRRMVEQARSDARRQTPFAKTPAAVDDEEVSTERREPRPDPDQDAEVVVEPKPPILNEPLEADHELTRDVPDEELIKNAASPVDESAADLDGLITKAPLPLPRSSPRVEIARPAEDIVSPSETVSETKRKPTRVRKPKVKEPSSEALNSDDRRIREELREDGLQKERYVPRPSRRRATQVAEVPIDFSVKPEKAAKAKRTKTTGGLKAGVDLAAPTFSSGSETPKAPAAASPTTNDSEKHITEPPEDPVKPDVSQRSPGHDAQQDDTLKDQAPAPLKSCMKSTVEAPVKGQDFVKPLPKLTSTSQSPMKAPDDNEVFVKPASKSNPVSSSPSKNLLDNDIFVKPTPKTKSISRVKRSQTTIFEDHVDFSSQRTPTLSQQQAKRQAALQNISSDAVEAKANQKKRRTVVDEDEDVEPDEKVQSPAKKQEASKPVLKPQAAPKKRRKIVEDDDEESEQGAGAPVEQEDELQPATDMEVAPKKRGRGRPPKAAAAMEPMQDNEAGTDANKSPEEVEEAPKKPAKGRKSRKSTGPSVNTQSLDNSNNGMDMENIEADEAPKKPGRGRKASTPAVKPTEVETEQGKDEAPKTPQEPRTTTNEAVDSTRPAAPGTQEPTPSPEKIAQAKAVALPPKPSPTSHSPLKSSSTAPLRVGLNKRQRIPPLLRSIRPVKPR